MIYFVIRGRYLHSCRYNTNLNRLTKNLHESKIWKYENIVVSPLRLARFSYYFKKVWTSIAYCPLTRKENLWYKARLKATLFMNVLQSLQENLKMFKYIYHQYIYRYTLTRAKAFRSVINRTRKLLTTRFYYFIACVWSVFDMCLISCYYYAYRCPRLLNRSFNKYFDSEKDIFYIEIKEAFLLGPVYPIEESQQRVSSFFFKKITY